MDPADFPVKQRLFGETVRKCQRDSVKEDPFTCVEWDVQVPEQQQGFRRFRERDPAVKIKTAAVPVPCGVGFCRGSISGKTDVFPSGGEPVKAPLQGTAAHGAVRRKSEFLRRKKKGEEGEEEKKMFHDPVSFLVIISVDYCGEGTELFFSAQK